MGYNTKMAGIAQLPQALKKAEALGRGTDTDLAHVTPGEFVLPREFQTPGIMAALISEMNKRGIDPGEFVVGSHKNKINPRTGQPEFFLGGLFGGGTRTTRSTQEYSIPQWLEDPARRLVERAETIGTQPFQPYTGERFTDLTPQQLEALQGFEEMLGMGQDELNAAIAMSRQLGRAPTRDEIQDFMNPYLQDVLDTTLGSMEQRHLEQTALNRARAGAIGAFGGNRLGVMEGQMTAEHLRDLAQAEAGLRASGYDQAVGQRERALMGGIQALSALGPMTQDMHGRQLQALFDAGGVRQMDEQRRRDFEFGEFLREQDDPFMRANFQAGILGAVPHGYTMTGTQQTPTASPFQQIAGMGIAALGAAGGIGPVAGLFGGGGVAPVGSAATGGIWNLSGWRP